MPAGHPSVQRYAGPSPVKFTSSFPRGGCRTRHGRLTLMTDASCLERPTKGTIRVPFGCSLADSKMYAPREVPAGKRCGCICPACKGKLRARHEIKGHKTPHFSHAPGADCAKGLETSVHLAAKQLIGLEKQLFLPKVEAKLDKVNALGQVHRRTRTLEVEGLKLLDSVLLEVPMGSIRPDLLVVPVGLPEVSVEIAVTHFVDTDKLARVLETKTALVEIDLSAYRLFTWDSLRQALFSAAAPREWLYHPAVEATTAAWEEELKPILAAIQKEAGVAKARQQEDEKAWAAEEQREDELRESQLRERRVTDKAAANLRANEKRAEQKESRARAKRFQARTEAEKRAILCQAYRRDRLPSALAARVSGGSSFGVQDHLVWQSALFGGLIDGAVAKGHSELGKADVVAWLGQRFSVKPDFVDAEKIAVWNYLQELAARGALVRGHGVNFRLKVATLAAFETLQAFRCGRVTSQRGLEWAAPDVWPSERVAETIALAHSGSSHLYGAWPLVASILPNVRAMPIADIVSHYADWGGPQLLEYWISAGFVAAVAAE
jgi:hypothetical protein